MPTNSSSARKARRSNGAGHVTESYKCPAQAACETLTAPLRQWTSAFVGVPLVEAHLRPGHRRPEGRNAGFRVVAGEGDARERQHGRQHRCGQGCRQVAGGTRREEGRQGSGVRSRSVSLSRARQGARGCGPRKRIELLTTGFERTEAFASKRLENTMAGERERGGGHRGGREERDSEFVDKLVHINRVAKVVKGGKRFGFAALVVIGDQKGRVGFGHGKAREVPEAIRKATESAKRNLTRVALREGRTLHHDIAGRHGAGRVYLRAAPAGTGIIAGGPMRAVFETLGIQDVVAKSIGSSNPYNMVRATFDALKHQDSPRSVAARRNIKVSTLQSRRVGGDAEVVAE